MKSVLIAIFEGVQSLDVTGPLEVFAHAREYSVQTAALGGGQVRTTSGLRLIPDADLRHASPPDLLLVPGGRGARRRDPELTEWLRENAPAAPRLASVCTGAFLLAAAGLLSGRHATTHWAYCGALAADYPDVIVEPDPIFVRDGRVITSAGVTAGIDLALALVEDDLGRDAALTVARGLVVFLRRPGNQSQFSANLAAQTATRRPLRDVQHWITEHPEADLSVDALACRAALSPRPHPPPLPPTPRVRRRDRHHPRPVCGPGPRRDGPPSPGGHRPRCRGDLPSLRLRDPTRHPSPLHRRRAFIRSMGVSPAEYRRRFHP